MKISLKNIISSLIIIALLFIFFLILVYFFKVYLLSKSTNNSITIKSNSSMVVTLTNGLPLADSIALENTKGTTSDDIFNSLEFEVSNNSSAAESYELFIVKENLDVHEIPEKYIKFFLCDENGTAIKGFNKNFVPVYSDLRALIDRPDARLIYKGTIDGNATKKFNLKSWVSDKYTNSRKISKFQYKLYLRIK